MVEWERLTRTGEGEHLLFIHTDDYGDTHVQPGRRQFGLVELDPHHGAIVFSAAELDALATKSEGVRALVTAVRDLLDIAANDYDTGMQTIGLLLGDPQAEYVRSLLAKFED